MIIKWLSALHGRSCPMNPTTSDGSQNRLGRSVLAIATGVVLLGAMPLLLVTNDGSGYHTHNFTKFFGGNSTTQLVKDQPMTIKGTMDVMTNGTMAWAGVDTTVTLTGKKTV